MGSSRPRRDDPAPEAEHFGGHRDGGRRLCVMPVALTGVSGSFGGRTIDLSRRGALIEVRDAKFPSGERSILEFAKRVAQEFPREFPVRFADLPLVVSLRVARVTRHPAASSLLIGCTFARPLTDRQCRLTSSEQSEAPGGSGTDPPGAWRARQPPICTARDTMSPRRPRPRQGRERAA